MNKAIVAVILIISGFILTGCGSQEQDWQALLSDSAKKAEHKLIRLETNINNGLVSNTQLLAFYADAVRRYRPELSEIVDVLAQDRDARGPVFQGLSARLRDAKTAIPSASTQGEAVVQALWSEFELISGAADPALFNMMLTDPINVLADMSEGRLARVAAMSKEATLQANATSSAGPGDQLVGNPNYGSWQSDGSGNSVWQWIGMYAVFNSMLNRPTYYGDWASRRNYSYYNDHGRSHYTSPGQRQKQSAVNEQAKSKFQKAGKTFNSPYARTRTGASGRVIKPTSMPTTSSFKSSYQRSSSTSSMSSTRNATTRTFRSSRGGK